VVLTSLSTNGADALPAPNNAGTDERSRPKGAPLHGLRSERLSLQTLHRAGLQTLLETPRQHPPSRSKARPSPMSISRILRFPTSSVVVEYAAFDVYVNPARCTQCDDEVDFAGWVFSMRVTYQLHDRHPYLPTLFRRAAAQGGGNLPDLQHLSSGSDYIITLNEQVCLKCCRVADPLTYIGMQTDG
jgi:hypothetical protein